MFNLPKFIPYVWRQYQIKNWKEFMKQLPFINTKKVEILK